MFLFILLQCLLSLLFFGKNFYSLQNHSTKKPEWKYLLYLILGTIPIAIFGFFFRNQVELLFSNSAYLQYAFLFTALMLMLSKYKLADNRLDWISALIIGVFQALALIPGISRSGMTLTIALIIGLRRKEAAKFSFFLALPALFGAFILELPKVAAVPLGGAIVGFLAAFCVGFVSLKLLLRVIQSKKLHYFAPWAVLMAILVSLLI